MSSEYTSVVLTGAAGWLGKTMQEALIYGLPDCPDIPAPPFGDISLRLFDIEPLATGSNSRVSIVRGDLRKIEDCRRLFAELDARALVLHCAGLIHPRRTAMLDEVNVRGIANLFLAAKEAEAARIVAVSSNSPCGCNRHNDERFTEESEFRPYMSYGRSKMRMEKIIRAQKLPAWTILRAPWFYGPHQPERQTQFFRMIKHGQGPVVGGGDNYRSMAYIGNLAQGIVRAAKSRKAAGQTYWIADAESYTMNQIIDTVELLLERDFNFNCRRRRLRLPGVVSEIALLCDFMLQSAGFYNIKIHVLSEMNKTIACDISKSRRELGYNPKIALEEGMRRSIADLVARKIAI